jgi:hypothetical protein
MITPVQITYAKFSKLTIGNINFAAGGVYKDFIRLGDYRNLKII